MVGELLTAIPAHHDNSPITLDFEGLKNVEAK
jgi:hypothetical protein